MCIHGNGKGRSKSDSHHVRSKFVPLKEVDTILLSDLKKLASTEHFSEERKERLETALSVSFRGDRTYNTFLVDTGHPDGYELHNITKSGLDIVLNESKYYSGKPCLVTILIARPQQIRRLYDDLHKAIPSGLISTCEEHKRKGLNI